MELTQLGECAISTRGCMRGLPAPGVTIFRRHIDGVISFLGYDDFEDGLHLHNILTLHACNSCECARPTHTRSLHSSL